MKLKAWWTMVLFGAVRVTFDSLWRWERQRPSWRAAAAGTLPVWAGCRVETGCGHYRSIQSAPAQKCLSVPGSTGWRLMRPGSGAAHRENSGYKNKKRPLENILYIYIYICIFYIQYIKHFTMYFGNLLLRYVAVIRRPCNTVILDNCLKQNSI